jgi:hypothetical protein
MAFFNQAVLLRGYGLIVTYRVKPCQKKTKTSGTGVFVLLSGGIGYLTI